ncbi:protein kinase [Bacillus sp. FJAT-27445]|uniref:serine/threonine protein kinase n=1 Tax=Bacillus sp. FJAT-27445 TaxID=1679166 RepID=UPI000743B70E|nr:protein kinase [Bacillus sp. FJAT-27445]
MYKNFLLACSNAFEKPMQKGELIEGKYEIIKLLGTGGYGHTYLAFDTVQGKEIALKTLRLHKRFSRSERQSFLKEQEFMQLACHPSIPAFYGNGIHKGIPFFIMEFKKGKNFEQLIFEEGRMYSERESFVIAYKLLDILDYLHAKGIIHRDIRIPNVLMDQHALSLLDFGLSCTEEESAAFTERTHNKLRKGKNRQTDFYGLGHFLLFLLYSGYSASEGQPEKSWEEELKISSKARGILRRLLLIDREYTGCGEIKADIGQIIFQGDETNVVI